MLKLVTIARSATILASSTKRKCCVIHRLDSLYEIEVKVEEIYVRMVAQVGGLSG